MKTIANTYAVTYTKKTGGIGEIIVRARNEQDALRNAKFLCYTGSNFRNAIITDKEYTKPRKQGYFGSHRMNK